MSAALSMPTVPLSVTAPPALMSAAALNERVSVVVAVNDPTAVLAPMAPLKLMLPPPAMKLTLSAPAVLPSMVPETVIGAPPGVLAVVFTPPLPMRVIGLLMDTATPGVRIVPPRVRLETALTSTPLLNRKSSPPSPRVRVPVFRNLVIEPAPVVLLEPKTFVEPVKLIAVLPVPVSRVLKVALPLTARLFALVIVSRLRVIVCSLMAPPVPASMVRPKLGPLRLPPRLMFAPVALPPAVVVSVESLRSVGEPVPNFRACPSVLIVPPILMAALPAKSTPPLNRKPALPVLSPRVTVPVFLKTVVSVNSLLFPVSEIV